MEPPARAPFVWRIILYSLLAAGLAVLFSVVIPAEPFSQRPFSSVLAPLVIALAAAGAWAVPPQAPLSPGVPGAGAPAPEGDAAPSGRVGWRVFAGLSALSLAAHVVLGLLVTSWRPAHAGWAVFTEALGLRLLIGAVAGTLLAFGIMGFLWPILRARFGPAAAGALAGLAWQTPVIVVLAWVSWLLWPLPTEAIPSFTLIILSGPALGAGLGLLAEGWPWARRCWLCALVLAPTASMHVMVMGTDSWARGIGSAWMPLDAVPGFALGLLCAAAWWISRRAAARGSAAR